ncbi:Fur family transcriptional regulator [Gulosibacter sp. 10]|uniref:Fur family transcriptional regulator n=1 Tax=Gulosibacter sp. 10 TaxID=1255570 RepID=UPI00097EDED9|nr:Fur family transcriptional regulator [Gulosibacter sp. 10]SJM62590.1 Transcriptional regulator, FUR family [Gulosibacter sp. 10]
MEQATSRPVPAWAERLRGAGLRVTAGRLAALEYLEHHPHSSAVEIHAGIGQALPSITLQSAHNIVHDLQRRGLIRRIDLPDSAAARYETRVDEHHHHVQCVECGLIEDVEVPAEGVPFLEPRMHHGVRILDAEVTFKGLCAECLAARADARDENPSQPPQQPHEENMNVR